jgi:glycosyltransferase involved in cell wall biosynthesis
MGGTLTGLSMVRRYRPDVIWSTFPIATAHIIGLLLHRLTGLPWVADFRDPTTEPGYANRPGHLWLERRIVRHAARMTFTTPSTLRMYSERYSAEPASRWLELPNGYDEDMFRSAELEPANRPASRPLTLVHSGVLYQIERDPRPFFAAIAKLKAAGIIDAATLQVVLRGTHYDSLYAPLLAAEGIDDIVQLADSIPYRAALREMLDADGLLIFQAANCNVQIPAKLYECLRAGRPIFALTDSAGDTAGVMRSTGAGTIAPIDDSDTIAQRLAQFIAEVRSGSARTAGAQVVSSYSRRSLTSQLAECFNAVTATSTRPAQAR